MYEVQIEFLKCELQLLKSAKRFADATRQKIIKIKIDKVKGEIDKLRDLKEVEK